MGLIQLSEEREEGVEVDCANCGQRALHHNSCFSQAYQRDQLKLQLCIQVFGLQPKVPDRKAC